jgi:acyl-coenzyme A synthetase/AMP-(fatty) acid ligase
VRATSGVINIVDALPKGPTGKILKREIALTVDQARATEA